ncbi:MAG TPA: hypothetical protein ENI46_02640, partial [Firmicutes bacterium]|nr:hypothetical protein [Bacillota bacterium]
MVGIIAWTLVDVTLTAKAYYISQPPGSVHSTQGIEWLREALGRQALWRTKPIHQLGEDVLVLPCNTNQIFGIPSIDGLSTMFPTSYAYLKENKIGTEATITTPVHRRSWLASPVEDLMGVRFLLAPQDAPTFTYEPLLRDIVISDSLARLTMFETMDGTRSAFVQRFGDTVRIDVGVPYAGRLDFKVGFHCERSEPGDSIEFVLRFKVGNIVRTCRRSFDLEHDRDRWHRASLDLGGLGGRMARVLM